MDVSKADVLAATISSRRVNVEQWPVAYSLIFETLSIEDRMSYSIQARVLSPDGRLLAPRLLGAKRKSRV
jgi:uncharacterized lipoprotein YbaY